MFPCLSGQSASSTMGSVEDDSHCLSFAQVRAAMMKILKYIKGRPKMFESPDYPLFVLYLDRWNALYIGNEGVVEELFFLRQY